MESECYFKVGDRVAYHKPDRDGHVFTKDCNGTIEEIIETRGGQRIRVKWDDDMSETLTENDLVLV
jgi:hypothetical protein